MAQVTGNIRHFGLEPIPQERRLKLVFVPSNAAVGNQTVLPEKWDVRVEPAPDGNFTVSLAATENLRPAGTFYRIAAAWWHESIDGEGYWEHDEFFPFRLYVPINGGEIGDLLRADTDRSTVVAGPEPDSPVKGMWWLDESGTLWEWSGSMWVEKSQIEVLSAAGTPREQYVGNNLTLGRISWPGPVYWVTTAASGYPSGALAGDTLWRVATSERQQTVYDTFTRADGPAGNTPVGALPWSSLPGGADTVSPVIISNQLGLSGVTGSSTTGSGAGVNFGPDGYFRWRAAALGTSRTTAFVFRWTDNQNLIAIAHRTSGSDSTARIVSYVGGVSTIVGSLGVPIEADDQVEVQMRGADIEVSVNDVTRWAGTLSQNLAGRWCGVTRSSTDGLFRLGAVSGGLVV